MRLGKEVYPCLRGEGTQKKRVLPSARQQGRIRGHLLADAVVDGLGDLLLVPAVDEELFLGRVRDEGRLDEDRRNALALEDREARLFDVLLVQAVDALHLIEDGGAEAEAVADGPA